MNCRQVQRIVEKAEEPDDVKALKFIDHVISCKSCQLWIEWTSEIRCDDVVKVVKDGEKFRLTPLDDIAPHERWLWRVFRQRR